jgi:hypothetical protein
MLETAKKFDPVFPTRIFWMIFDPPGLFNSTFSGEFRSRVIDCPGCNALSTDCLVHPSIVIGTPAIIKAQQESIFSIDFLRFIYQALLKH